MNHHCIVIVNLNTKGHIDLFVCECSVSKMTRDPAMWPLQLVFVVISGVVTYSHSD